MTLAQGRDIALIILAIEAFVIGLISLAIVYLIVRIVGRLIPKVRSGLQVAYEWALQGEAFVSMLMHWLLAPILFLSGLRAGVEQGVAALRRR